MSDDADALRDWVDDHPDLLARVLVSGTPEARAYGLTAIVEGGRPRDIDRVIAELEDLRDEVED